MPQSNAGTGAPGPAQAAQVDAANGTAAPAEQQRGNSAERGDTAPRLQREDAAEPEIRLPEASDLAEHLNLPPEIRKQIQEKSKDRKPEAEKPKAEDGSRKSEEAEQHDEAASDTDALQSQQAESEEEGEESESDEETETEEQQGQQQQRQQLSKAEQKMQKRIARLTKQLKEAERFIASVQAQQAEGAERGDAAPRLQQQQAAATPLARAQTEQQIDRIVDESERLLDLVEANLETGLTLGEGANARFVEPKELKAWKREAERNIHGAEARRREIREAQAAQQQFLTARQKADAEAQKDFPELFDEESDDFKTAIQIASGMPWILQYPDANYRLGVYVEGFKAINARKGKKNGAANAPNLDVRLTPEHQRSHIPPTPKRPAPNPPSRSVSPSQLPKEVANAVEKFTKPGGTTREGLARAFEALDTDETPANRRAVAV